MSLEPISSSEVNNPLVKIINQLVSEFNIHSPVTSQSEFRPSSEINPDTEFIMVTPIINMDVVSIPVNIQIMHVKHPVGHGQTEQRIKLEPGKDSGSSHLHPTYLHCHSQKNN